MLVIGDGEAETSVTMGANTLVADSIITSPGSHAINYPLTRIRYKE